jgi:hypothetical protein
MIKTIYIPIFILILSLSACNQKVPISPSPTPASGIEGQVTEGPMCPGPVASGDNTCPDQPYQATISVFDKNNKLITQFESDRSGLFKLPLSPGTYLLHPESDKSLPHAADQSVVVITRQFTQVTIVYDTGMR